MSLTRIDSLRVRASSSLDDKKQAFLGQFFTPAPICNFMASLFDLNINNNSEVRLLDPGCGIGSLTAAFLDMNYEALDFIDVDMYDIDADVFSYLEDGLSKYISEDCVQVNLFNKDFLADNLNIFSNKKSEQKKYTHVIANPPYKKMSPSTETGCQLIKSGFSAVNYYSSFIEVSINALSQGGELVCIIPRSFCSGTYYKKFRKFLLSNVSIKRIHIFDSRTKVFSVDRVLQENVILHLKKDGNQGNVIISSSSGSDFYYCHKDKQYTSTGYMERTVNINDLVRNTDPDKYIHIAVTEDDQKVIDAIESLNGRLSDFDVSVSTGPVVDFRNSENLYKKKVKDTVPIFFPSHLNGTIHWPKQSKKPNYIRDCEKTKNLLWENSGNYIIVKRFTSKEEDRRVVASLYDANLDYKKVAFDNKLNVYHLQRKGISESLARGLYIYLNSSIVDKYFRCFNGHTQINAADLLKIPYPEVESLDRIGRKEYNIPLSQEEIDSIIADAIFNL